MEEWLIDPGDPMTFDYPYCEIEFTGRNRLNTTSYMLSVEILPGPK